MNQDSAIIGCKRDRKAIEQQNEEDSGYLTFSEDEIVPGGSGWYTLNGCKHKQKTLNKL